MNVQPLCTVVASMLSHGPTPPRQLDRASAFVVVPRVSLPLHYAVEGWHKVSYNTCLRYCIHVYPWPKSIKPKLSRHDWPPKLITIQDLESVTRMG